MEKLGDTAKTSVQTSLYLFIGKISSTVILALTSIYISRTLDPENYGIYALATVAASFLAQFCDFGISAAMTRYIANLRFRGNDEEASNLIKIGLLFKISISTSLAILLFFLSDFIAINVFNRPVLAGLIKLTPLLVIGQSVSLITQNIFIGLDEAKYSSTIMIVPALIKVVLAVSLLNAGFGVSGAIIATVMSTALASILGISIYILHSRSHPSEDSVQSSVPFTSGLRRLFSFGAPLYISNIALTIIKNFELIILAMYVTDIAIGNYKVTTNFTQFMLILIYPIQNSLLSAFSRYNINSDKNSLDKIFRVSVKFASLIVLPVTILLATLSKDVISILYGAQYQFAPDYLRYYILTYVLIGFGRFVVNSFFNSQGDTKINLSINLIKSVIIFSTLSLLTSNYGVFGLIMSIIISDIVTDVYALYMFNRKYSMTLNYSPSFRILISALFPTCLIIILQTLFTFTNPAINLAVYSLFFLIIYMFTIPFTGAIDKTDLKNIEFMTREFTWLNIIAKPLLSFESKLLSLKKR